MRSDRAVTSKVVEKKSCYSFFGGSIVVGPRHGADLGARGIVGDVGRLERTALSRGWAGVQNVAPDQRPAADLGAKIGGFAAHDAGHVDPPGDRKVGPDASCGESKGKQLSLAQPKAFPAGRLNLGSAEGDDSILQRAQRQASHRDLQRRFAPGVADEDVGRGHHVQKLPVGARLFTEVGVQVDAHGDYQLTAIRSNGQKCSAVLSNQRR
jgi:hypothetical protein